MFKKIDHIGIAVADLDEATRLYTALSGRPPEHEEEVADQKVRAAFFPVGESRIELLSATAPDSPIAKFLEKRGGKGGLHHLCFQVEGIAERLKVLKAAGVRLIDEEPRRGAHDCLVAFVHPDATGGVLIELSEPINKAYP